MRATSRRDGSSTRASDEAVPQGGLVRTSEVTVIFTTLEGTMAALRVAAAIGRACCAPVRLIAQQPPQASPFVRVPPVRDLVHSDAFRTRLALEIDARVEVFVCVCRGVADVARTLLGRHSLVVIGGRRSWWPTRPERLRRALEAQGHLVLFVNEAEHAA